MTAYIVDIEAVDSRYTRQWKQHLPKQLERSTNSNVIVISGGEVPQATTPGAFLNFAGTNDYKSQQMLEISRLFAEGNIKDGDYFSIYRCLEPYCYTIKVYGRTIRYKCSHRRYVACR